MPACLRRGIRQGRMDFALGSHPLYEVVRLCRRVAYRSTSIGVSRPIRGFYVGLLHVGAWIGLSESSLGSCGRKNQSKCGNTSVRGGPARRVCVKAELLPNRTGDLDPLRDPRWCMHVQSFSASSIFHSAAWLRALHQTYGYRPEVLTTSDDRKGLGSALLFCSITSRLTGRRLVSLPFSDHCEPLAHNVDDLLEPPTSAEGGHGRQRVQVH